MTDDLIRQRDRWMNDCLDAIESENKLRRRAEKAEAEVAKLRAIKPLSASDLANALGCFWNAAIGAAHERQSVGAMDTACIMAAGVAAIEQRLLEVSALTAPADPQPDAHNAAIRAAAGVVSEEIARARDLGPHHIPVLSACQRAILALLRPEGGE